MYKKVIFCLLLCIFIATGCTKVPDEFKSTSMQVSYAQEDDKDYYLLNFSSRITNDNSDRALQDIKGKAVFRKTGADSNKIVKLIKQIPFMKADPVMELSFDIPIILPFKDNNITIEKKLTAEEIAPLIKFMSMDIEKIKSADEPSNVRITNTHLELEIEDYEQENILDLLEEKINEKDK